MRAPKCRSEVVLKSMGTTFKMATKTFAMPVQWGPRLCISRNSRCFNWRTTNPHTNSSARWSRTLQTKRVAQSLQTQKCEISSSIRLSSTKVSPGVLLQDDKHLPKSTHPEYSPPRTGIVSLLPSSWIPYAELARIDKPTGTYYLFFPCLFSTLLAAPLTNPITALPTVAFYSGLFFTGAMIMRGAGCTINDLWDRNLDPHVERTRLRPIARGAVSPTKAIVFTGAQLIAGLGILLSFPHQCLYYGIPSLVLVTLYPLAKRVTYYPQFVLGLTFSWGAWMGFPALGLNIFSFDPSTWALTIADTAAFTAAACLYSSCIVWTLIYDMIYAFQDIRDDAKIGIKSIALAHQTNTKLFMYSLACGQVGLLAGAGYAVGAGLVYGINVVCLPFLALCAVIHKVELKDPKDCWKWFKRGCLTVGATISLGLFNEYLAQRWNVYVTDEKEPSVIETR